MIRIPLPESKDTTVLIDFFTKHLGELEEAMDIGPRRPLRSVWIDELDVTAVNWQGESIEVCYYITCTEGCDGDSHTWSWPGSVTGRACANEVVFELCEPLRKRAEQVDALASSGELGWCSYCPDMAKNTTTGSCLSCGRWEDSEKTGGSAEPNLSPQLDTALEKERYKLRHGPDRRWSENAPIRDEPDLEWFA